MVLGIGRTRVLFLRIAAHPCALHTHLLRNQRRLSVSEAVCGLCRLAPPAQVDGKRQLLMSGTGASPEGNKPFLDLLDIDSKESTRLWQSSPPYLESVGSIMSDNNDVSGLTKVWWPPQSRGMSTRAATRQTGCQFPCTGARYWLSRPLCANRPEGRALALLSSTGVCKPPACKPLKACCVCLPVNDLQDAPITLEGLQLLLSRESTADPPQTYLISFNSSGEEHKMQPHEQRITDFPHPYPQVRSSPGEQCSRRPVGWRVIQRACPAVLCCCFEVWLPACMRAALQLRTHTPLPVLVCAAHSSRTCRRRCCATSAQTALTSQVGWLLWQQ